MATNPREAFEAFICETLDGITNNEGVIQADPATAAREICDAIFGLPKCVCPPGMRYHANNCARHPGEFRFVGMEE